MKIVGLICLVLGLWSGFKTFTTDPPQQANPAYQRGYGMGRVTAALGLTGLGLWLLLRDRTTRPRPAASLPKRISAVPQPPPPPAAPAQIAVKLQCACGQKYEFEVQPVGGRMPAAVACPSCGADGTDAANAIIAQTLAARLETGARSPATGGVGRRKLHPAMWAGIGAVSVLVLLLAIPVAHRLRVQNRGRPPGQSPPHTSSERGDPSRSPMRRPSGSPTASAGGNARNSLSGRPGSIREAAPVPPDVTAVEVWWGNRWRPATILKREGERAYIHYEGRSSNFDEWVTPERLRPRRPL